MSRRKPVKVVVALSYADWEGQDFRDVYPSVDAAVKDILTKEHSADANLKSRLKPPDPKMEDNAWDLHVTWTFDWEGKREHASQNYALYEREFTPDD